MAEGTCGAGSGDGITAQYWKPAWLALEGQCRLHLAQARSNRGPRWRKTDFRDAKRIVSRLLSGDLILSYVPDAEQRGWRTLTRTLIHTCQLCGANSFDFLIELQLHAGALAANPAEWMPWNYGETIARVGV